MSVKTTRRVLLAAIAVLFALVLWLGIKAGPAGAHKPANCKHTTIYWTFYRDGAHPLQYQQVFQYANGLQNAHYHQYRTRVYGTPLPGIWNYVDEHYRHCPEPV